MISPGDLTDALSWRYATKRFDSQRTLAPETLAALKESLRLSPSSFGLELWKFHFISNAEIKARLREASWGQSQVVDCSHHVVITVRREISPADGDAKIASLYAQGAPPGSLDAFRDILRGFLSGQPFGVSLREWATRQCYLALGQLMTSAAMLGVDSCPMEGIEPAQYDQILGLEQSPHATVVACSLGYRHPEDSAAKRPKHRKDASEVIAEIA